MLHKQYKEVIFIVIILVFVTKNVQIKYYLTLVLVCLIIIDEVECIYCTVIYIRHDSTFKSVNKYLYQSILQINDLFK